MFLVFEKLIKNDNKKILNDIHKFLEVSEFNTGKEKIKFNKGNLPISKSLKFIYGSSWIINTIRNIFSKFSILKKSQNTYLLNKSSL